MPNDVVTCVKLILVLSVDPSACNVNGLLNVLGVDIWSLIIGDSESNFDWFFSCSLCSSDREWQTCLAMENKVRSARTAYLSNLVLPDLCLYNDAHLNLFGWRTEVSARPWRWFTAWSRVIVRFEYGDLKVLKFRRFRCSIAILRVRALCRRTVMDWIELFLV